MEEISDSRNNSFSSNPNEFQLKVRIQSYELKSISADSIFYRIELNSEVTNKTWYVSRGYKEFLELHANFLEFFIRVPYFPQNLPEKKTNDLEIRKTIVEKYLKELIKRPDFINSIQLKNFLELDNHFNDFHIFQPLILFEIFDLPLSISIINFSKKNNLLFVGHVNNITYSSLLYSFFGFSSTKKKEESYQGGLSICHLSKNYSGEIHVEQIKFLGYPSPVNCINIMDEEDIVAVGLNDGTIYLYKINLVNTNIMLKSDLCEEISCIKAHHYKVVNIALQYSTGYVYSCAEEGVLVISEMNYQSVMKVFEVSKHIITCMFFDKDPNRIIMTDASGTIWIISVKSLPPMILQAIHNQLPNITSLEVNVDKNFIFIGNNVGRISFYDFDDHNANDLILEKRLEILSDYKLNVKKINFKCSKNELIVAFSNGSLGIYSYNEDYPEFILDSHSKEVNSTYWDDENKILITSSCDNRIKIWQLPAYWPSEMMRNKSLFNKKSFFVDNSIKSLNIFKLKEAFSKEDSFKLNLDLLDDSSKKDINEEIIITDNSYSDRKVEYGLDLRYEISHKIIKDDLLGWDL